MALNNDGTCSVKRPTPASCPVPQREMKGTYHERHITYELSNAWEGVARLERSGKPIITHKNEKKLF